MQKIIISMETSNRQNCLSLHSYYCPVFLTQNYVKINKTYKIVWKSLVTPQILVCKHGCYVNKPTIATILVVIWFLVGQKIPPATQDSFFTQILLWKLLKLVNLILQPLLLSTPQLHSNQGYHSNTPLLCNPIPCIPITTPQAYGKVEKTAST